MAGDMVFTSESVTEGHPDKIADQISDSVLDAVLSQDPLGRVACETLLTTGLVLVAGEISTTATLDVPQIVRGVVREIGYTSSEYGFDADTCAVNGCARQAVARHRTGRRLGPGDARSGGDALDRIGAGDQGMMFGFACDETPQLMPLPLMLAHAITRRLATVRRDDTVPALLPDGKAQVTVRYRRDSEGVPEPVCVERVVVSSQHRRGTDMRELRAAIVEHVVRPSIPAELLDDTTLRRPDFVLVNPTGVFEVGGPMGDAGLTGRKIIVDTYGGMARHGGGAFSGKDPTKVDRSAAYACRWVAKNIVAAGLARRCELQVAYAIGVAAPGEPQRRDVRHPPGRPGCDRRARARALRPAPGRDPARSRPAPPDLPRHGGLRALRPRAGGLHLGAHGSRRVARTGARCERGQRLSDEESSARSRSIRARLATNPCAMILAVTPPLAVRVVPLVTTRALREPLDYLAPEHALARGDVVHVPLAGRSVRGVVVEAAGPSQHEGELARVERLADEPRIAPVVLELCLWIAAYYGSTPARALALALPPRVRAPSDTWVSATGLPGTTARRRALLELLADGPLPLAELVERAGTTAATVRRLAKDGLVSLDARLRVPRVTAGRTPPPEALTAAADGRRRARSRGCSRRAGETSCSTESRDRARPRSTCAPPRARSRAAARCSCWCPRSRSRRRPLAASPRASAIRSRCCTPGSPTGSAGPCATPPSPATCASSWARAPPSSRRCRTSA